MGDGSALPVGTPIPWVSYAPTGWLNCNGAAFSAALYPKLALAYPNLTLPDLRGEFIRGWDAGRGVDSGRALLSAQGFLVESHTHNLNYRALLPEVEGATYFGGVTSATKVGLTSQMSSYGGTETRPRNVAFNYIVRAA
ncbi:phage tail protein [Enterobacter soli]|uniref:phage tail protein n=1 Tax=Enterobacter soli TaxID=885040 RepID=UPI002F416313